MYTAFVLTDKCQAEIKQNWIPFYKTVICHHVTHEFGVAEGVNPPNMPESIKVVGYAANGVIEAFIVEVNGSITRPDGKIYHLTYSLDKQFAKPVDSNRMIEEEGWSPIDNFELEVIPQLLN